MALQQPEERYRILNASSNCPYGKCDGSGISIIEDTKTGETFGKPCECKDILMYNKILNGSKTPEIFRNITLNNFKIDIYAAKEEQVTALFAKRAAYNFILHFEEFKVKGKGLYFYSRNKGTGKTMLAVAAANSIIKKYAIPLKFISSLDLLDEIKKTYNEGSKYSESDLMDCYRNIDVLVIDDIGVERQTSWISDKLYSILNYRMENKKVTLFTSNCKVGELNLDERIVSRINIMAVPVKLPEESIRRHNAANDNLYFEKILYGQGDV
jgi:DNA replication protein DnaC